MNDDHDCRHEHEPLSPERWHVEGGASLTSDQRAKGLEPSTFSLEGCEPGAEATEGQEVTSTLPSVCTNACTDGSESTHEQAANATFADALAMVARLPLSDDEKAEAVRRLLAEREGMKA